MTLNQIGPPVAPPLVVAVSVWNVGTGLTLEVGVNTTGQPPPGQVTNQVPLPMLTPLVIPRYTIHTTITAPRRTTVFRALKFLLLMTFAPSCLGNLFTSVTENQRSTAMRTHLIAL